MADVSKVGVAVSSGDFDIYVKDNAFDGNKATYWSGQSGSGGKLHDYIGRNFGKPVQVKAAIVDDRNDGVFVSSVLAKYSTDGINWTTIGTYSINPSTPTFICVDAYPEAQYFAFMSNDFCSDGTRWRINEIRLSDDGSFYSSMVMSGGM